MTTNIRDPRSVVTPDGFHVSEAMLGLPLAPPGRRAAAMLIDLVVIGLVTAFVSGWGYFVWGVIGVVMVQLAFRTPAGSWTRGQLGQVTAWAYRGSVGCLGLFVLLMVFVVWLAGRTDFDEEQIERAVRQLAEVEAVEGVERVVAPDAPAPVVDSALAAQAAALEPAELASTLVGLDATDAPDSVTVAGATLPVDVWAGALRARAIDLFAADTVTSLEQATVRGSAQVASLREDLAAAEAAADSGFLALVRDVFEQLGSAFGVWTLYFTVATVVLRGRTIGKLLTRIRVVRLDGERLTWMPSLERAGGYAAGLATGLMGFLRIFWDRNRQCVHDRIVGTVVVLDGAAVIPGSWEEVWTESEETEEPDS